MPEIIADKYEVLETIGRGGMGTVYKARQTNLDRVVAIKMLSEELASDPEFRARFQQEATVVARLNHPNIVQVHDIEPYNNTFCIIMEFVDGENLQAKIDRDVTLPEREVVAIGAQVARALAFAHTKGVIHRDIKPDNIHVTPKGVAKVMDFGIARFMDSKLKTQTGISMGTPKFMSPEQVTGKNVDGQTDLYSLGVCLYYCLAGRPPFDGENAISVATRHLYEQPEPPSKMNSSISPAVEKVILHAMEKQKANRYTTGIEMAEALEATLGTKTSVRIGAEADAAFGGATTQRIQSQTPISPMGAIPSTADATASFASSPISPSAGQATMTPISSRLAPQLDPDFRTPAADPPTSDSTQSFNRSLIVFGGIVLIAAILLIILVLWLRSSDNSATNYQSDAVPQQVNPSDKLEITAQEANQLVKEGELLEARNVWITFRRNYPEVQPDRVKRGIDEVETLLPITQTEILGERRKQIGIKYSNEAKAIASAYLKAAADISEEIANSSFTSSTLNLQRKLNTEPAEADIVRAQKQYALATQNMRNNQFGAATGQALIDAVVADETDPKYWGSLGDFFLHNQLKDDARVMYGEAFRRAKSQEQKDEFSRKINALN